ncbi:MAG: RNA-binding transcriptional accessory protein, partial [Clostridia bacterium]|nr:RNA-binding transcriptional accessory protein [Clostridia bacterium]
MDEITLLATEFKLRPEHVKNIIELIDSGSTIPFIARYRKEMTGACDDQVLRALSDRLTYVRNLAKRKAEVLSSITD